MKVVKVGKVEKTEMSVASCVIFDKFGSKGAYLAPFRTHKFHVPEFAAGSIAVNMASDRCYERVKIIMDHDVAARRMVKLNDDRKKPPLKDFYDLKEVGEISERSGWKYDSRTLTV